MFQHEAAARQYARDSLAGAFARWRFFGTDLYNAAVALNSTEYRNRMGQHRGVINTTLLQKLLRDIGNGRGNHMDYSKFTMDAQRSFNDPSAINTALRRRIADYDSLSTSQREQLMQDMARYYAPFGGKGDMLGISTGKAQSSPGSSFLKWAAKIGLLAWGSYEFGKSLVR